MRTRYVLPLITLFLMIAGCSGDEAQLGAPEGWQSNDSGTRWWKADVDTSTAFRDLESLQSMGVMEGSTVYASSMRLARQTETAIDQLNRAVKQDLDALFRNEPQVVDSIFEEYVQPDISEAVKSGNINRGDPESTVERLRNQGVQTVREHFREPAPLKQASLSHPDSLRSQGVGGEVQTQVYVNEEGNPVAVKLVKGVHPVLNALTMRATTRMNWNPADLKRNNEWMAIPSWVRFNVTFPTS